MQSTTMHAAIILVLLLLIVHRCHLVVWASSMLRLCDESCRLSSVLGVLRSIIGILSEFLGALLLRLRHLVLWLIIPWTTASQDILELWLLLLQLL